MARGLMTGSSFRKKASHRNDREVIDQTSAYHPMIYADDWQYPFAYSTVAECVYRLEDVHEWAGFVLYT
jgi:hypothetical protein